MPSSLLWNALAASSPNSTRGLTNVGHAPLVTPAAAYHVGLLDPIELAYATRYVNDGGSAHVPLIVSSGELIFPRSTEME